MKRSGIIKVTKKCPLFLFQKWTTFNPFIFALVSSNSLCFWFCTILSQYPKIMKKGEKDAHLRRTDTRLQYIGQIWILYIKPSIVLSCSLSLSFSRILSREKQQSLMSLKILPPIYYMNSEAEEESEKERKEEIGKEYVCV